MKSAGNATLNVLFMIVILMLVLSGGMALVSAGRNYGLRLVRQEEKQQTALAILASIEKDMGLLKEDDADSPQSNGVTMLISRYDKYDLSIVDVSSGINARFMPESLLEKDAVKILLAQQSKEDVMQYGWMHSQFLPTKTQAEVKQAFSQSNAKNLFPLINDFPMVNIHFLSEKCLKAFVEAFEAFSIKDGDAKSDELFASSRQRDLKDSDIESILEVKKDNPILAFLGSKTAFWRIVYKTDDFTVIAIFAAVPKKTEDPRKIDRYMLMERRIIFA